MGSLTLVQDSGNGKLGIGEFATLWKKVQNYLVRLVQTHGSFKTTPVNCCTTLFYQLMEKHTHMQLCLQCSDETAQHSMPVHVFTETPE